MQILLQSWPFIVILLYIWLYAAYVKNPFGLGKNVSYVKFPLFFWLMGLFAVTEIATTTFVFSNYETPIFNQYFFLIFCFVPFLSLATATFKGKNSIPRKQLADFFLFRSPRPQNPLELGDENIIDKGYPFLEVILAAIGVTILVGTLVFAEFQTCSTLDIMFGVSGCRAEITKGNKGLETISYSPNGSHLAIGGLDGFLQIVNSQNLDQQQNLAGDKDFDVATFSPDSSLMASANMNGEIDVWKVIDGSLLRKFTMKRDYMTSDVYFSFSPDNSLLAAGSPSAGVKIWRLSDGSLIHAFDNFGNSVAFSPSGKLLATESTDGKDNIVFWNVADWSIAETLPVQAGILAFSKNGEQIVNSYDNKIELWDIVNKKLIQQIQLGFKHIAISADGQYLAIVKADEQFETHATIEVWNINSGKLVKSWELPNTDEPESLSISPDGKDIAIAYSYQVVQIWRVGT